LRKIDRKSPKVNQLISDEEVWLAIRYLDPDVGRKANGRAAIIAFLAISGMITMIWTFFHFRG